MKTPLAWHNLVHNRLRTAAAVAGVTFAVVLIFLQLGFRGITEKTASLIYDALDFDLLIRSKHGQRLVQCGPIPRVRLYQAASVPGVREVSPLWLGYSRWQPLERESRPILTVGVRPGETIFLVEQMQRQIALLTAPEFLLIDRASRCEFGPRNGSQFGDDDVGAEAELGYRRVRLVGHFWLGTSFDADGICVLSEAGFRRIYPGWPSEDVSLGLVRLDPDVAPEEAAGRLKQVFEQSRVNDVDVLTRAEAIGRERWVWLWQMSLGLIFFMGVCVAIVVGSVIVYQVLSSDVASHLAEYATLKAMGYTRGYLARIVLQEALILAALGFLPGLLVSELLYCLTAWKTRLPMAMTLLRVASVLGLSLAMCVISGLAALRKLHQADPADLY
jgi:putative ABC transport system permease protein